MMNGIMARQNGKVMEPRAIWVDVARVLATLLIVLYHMPSSAFNVDSCPVFLRFIGDCFGSAGGPLVFFFAVSGYFTPPELRWGKRLRRIVMLLTVYMVWNGLYATGLNDERTFIRIFGFMGNPCADYPLWYVFALVELLIVQCVVRRFLPLMVLVLLGLVLYGQGWLVPIEQYVTIPAPFYALAFFVGSCCSRIPLERLRKSFLYGLPLFAVLAVMLEPSEIHAFVAACLLLSVGSLLQCCWEKGARFVANLAPAAFLCYTIHAGIILGSSVLLARFCPSLLASDVLYGILPFCIYALSVVLYQGMRKWTPALLPIAAYSGHPEWLDRILQRCSVQMREK